MQPTITKKIEDMVFELLEKHPDGMRWKDLDAQIKNADHSLHPKTINGTIWKLPQKYPAKSDGLFRLK